jgi:glycosidase
MTKKLISGIFLFLLLISSVFADGINLERIEPPFWWTGFKNTELQILVYGEDIGKSRVEVNYPGVELRRVVAVENPNYLFVYVNVTPDTKPGEVKLTFTQGETSRTIGYRLLSRQGSENRHQGFDSSDVIYLLMPDRFANGDPSINNIPGMLEDVDMDEPFARKGGDIKGILNNLDYIKDLGMTALWINPIFENDMPHNYAIGAGFYHGYAATDLYKVDRRFGTNEDFLNLVQTSQEMGMKVILDMIHNHVGTHHWFIKDMPTSDWVHDQSVYGNTNYRTSVLMDPYASEKDFNSLVRAWFVDEMPDLDQRNPLLADYLIQNTIWWIEYSGIDGIRMDTHAYPYIEYMAEWSRIILEEYPDFNIVGEVWMPNVPTTAWWQYYSRISGDYNSFLPSVTDFPLYEALTRAFNESPGWETGLMRLYYTLSQDFLYTDPLLNVIFFDNHDLWRYAETVGNDPNKFKMAIAFLLTTRGIPQIFYGSELMFDMGGGSSDPFKRPPFPGGWPGDEINAFTHEGRVKLAEKRNLPLVEVFDYLRTLSHWRKDKEVIHTGKLTHFIPVRNIYVYFRQNENETVMVVMNGQDYEQTLRLDRFNEILHKYSKGTDVYSKKEFELKNELKIGARTALILELK